MILDKLFNAMAERQASDIFICAGAPIHIKIQGTTIPINQQIMEPAMIDKIAAELLNPQQVEAFEKNKEMNLSCGVAKLGNFRINLFRQRSSISIVIRYVMGNIPTLESLLLPPVLADLVMERRGLILIVGSTGSGKSTTLASMLDYRNANCSGHILTIEDPIEYLFRHKKSIVNQREIGMDTLGWESALKNAMRQAPDCILIGEIRDRETMQAAIAYAQTGHLCLGTLHANNSYHALNRVINFFPIDTRSTLYMDLSVTLKAIVSQRLVKRKDGKLIPAVEVLLNSYHVQELIEAGDITALKDAMEQSLAPGSRTFEQDLFRLYRSEAITLQEALQNADSPTNLSWLINNHESAGNIAMDEKPREPSFDPLATNPGSPSYKEFSLSLDDAASG
ncbi:MAG TPA: PilT/PilU family type 4a pilus ATPase [Candidatus Accumulibacter phosphatis]|nr:PilT/PilU family type 4a pilus ATPase [Candidatus Accumulibacter phosphatis]HRQ95554.1 PilT/PilU family type 4a pilus ATPase [Candidatus Accumulibacter phosphatis]